jgi:hypothetical protein
MSGSRQKALLPRQSEKKTQIVPVDVEILSRKLELQKCIVKKEIAILNCNNNGKIQSCLQEGFQFE